jgi:hypothetical protein
MAGLHRTDGAGGYDSGVVSSAERGGTWEVMSNEPQATKCSPRRRGAAFGPPLSARASTKCLRNST